MSASTPAVIAVDIGGTDIKSAVVGPAGILARRTTSTGASAGPDAAVAAVLDTVRTLRSAAPPGVAIEALGVGSPGTVDEGAGVVVNAENLGWTGVPLRDILRDEIGLPVGFGHDVRLGALAEWRSGAGRGHSDLAFLSVGTGIAAALVLDDTMIVSGGYVGEVGHGGSPGARVDGEGGGAPCPCGGLGCAETFASAAGIARRYQRLSGVEVAGAAEVLALRSAGDEHATTAWDDAVAQLAVIIGDIVRVTGVGLVVVGGGLVRAGDTLLDALRRGVRDELTVHRMPTIAPAALGSDAGLLGAAIIGRAAEARSSAEAANQPAEARSSAEAENQPAEARSSAEAANQPAEARSSAEAESQPAEASGLGPPP